MAKRYDEDRHRQNSEPPAKREKTSPAKKKPKKARDRGTSAFWGRLGYGVLCFFLAVYLVLHSLSVEGFLVDVIGFGLKGTLGYGVWVLFPVLLLLSYWCILRPKQLTVVRVVSGLLLAVVAGSLGHIFLDMGQYAFSMESLGQLWTDACRLRSGGVVSGLLAMALARFLSTVGAMGLLLGLGAVLLVLLLRIEPKDVMAYFWKRQHKRARRAEGEVDEEDEDDEDDGENGGGTGGVLGADAMEDLEEVAEDAPWTARERCQPYDYPSPQLLEHRTHSVVAGQETGTAEQRLCDALLSFGILAQLQGVVKGPAITRYDLALEQGVRLSKLTKLSEDIALALGVSGVRIAPVTGKIALVGVEVPNETVSSVPIRQVLESEAFQTHPSSVAFALGQDIGGEEIVGDIARLPHLLIAGTTGSGKSVCTNAIIISLLYKASPSAVRFIMIDPKMVELGIYNGIPHLLVPVVTDPKKAAGALQWAVGEMLRRYAVFADCGVRDLASYRKQAQAGAEDVPQIVLFIDELADLMLVAAKEVEESICRLAQMGRAAGMHLVIATQRPSADVITGTMKANIPSRIAFAVASALESRIILDTPGAEKLMGKGDMLWSPLGASKPLRVQGCLITDEEVASVVSDIKATAESCYDAVVQEEMEAHSQGKEAEPNLELEGYDAYFAEAVDLVLEGGQASVSLLQRRLKLGYARAARIVDQMEDVGIVGALEGSKPRAVLMSREAWGFWQETHPL